MFRVNGTLIVFLAFLLCLVYSEDFTEISNPDAAPGTCISEAHNLLLRVGQTTPILGECLNARCEENGDITYTGCGAVDLPPNCKFVETNGNLPIPDCCDDDYICDE